ncbi:CaiB/BaiF CoA-transferase family protein [Ideonella sp. A 288]|uniref:CaiB/BaiF CoA transferase family protein n=1 Tax=Ideonella sp. A 288 TaxID=1962181 RepID=UPI000B4AC05E|nr:CoA transferase [Ideonella sp. A 288]
MNRPLTGIRIVDLSTVFSGPIATALLADQGAEVIKVESPEGDTCRMIGPAKGDLSATFIAANRGKRSIAIDLKSPAATPVLDALVRRADVLVDNFRPGVMARLGLQDERLAALNPRLIRLSITGYGADGPEVDAKVYDAVIQAVSGMAASHALPGGPPVMVSSALCDKLTSLAAAQAVTAALFARERDGRGRRVEVAMLDAVLAFQWPDAMYNHAFVDEPPPPFPEFGITQRPWRTADGWVATMNPQQAEFEAQCRALQRPDLAADPRFATLRSRNRHGAELRALLEPLMAERPTDELVASFRREGAPIGRVNARGEVLDHPQVRHNQALVEVDHGDPAQGGVGRVRLARAAARFDGAALPPAGAAAHLGEHGRAVMAELGFDDAHVARLVADGVLRLP